MMRPKAVRDALRRMIGTLPVRRRTSPPRTTAEELFSYRFQNPELLHLALTHKSAVPQGGKAWLQSNERLEFLGDAVLNCLITEYLFSRYPERTEGQLSKIKSLVVSRRALGQCATAMGLGDHLILGASERKSGGRSRRSLVSNAFEAVLGAIYLDGGLDSARSFLEQYLFCRIDEFVGNEEYVNYKSMILEMSQRDGFGIPRYELVKTTGPDHAMQFRMRVEVAGVNLGEGTGPNKKSAEQQAAYMATLNYDKNTILSQSKGVQ